MNDMNEETLKEAWELFLKERELSYSSNLNPWEMFKAGFIAGTKQKLNLHGVSGKRPDLKHILKYKNMKSRMIINNDKRKSIKWDVPEFGLFEATIWNGKLTDFRACENGSIATIRSENILFLERLRDSLSDLLDELDVGAVGQTEKNKNNQ